MATLLPNAKQVFLDLNGVPLSGGKVTFYIAGTSTPKDTYQDAAETILNTNPVILDAAGSAIIYGSGSYRQVVADNVGNLIWDQVTGDTSAATASWGGFSTGALNAQVVSTPNFTSQDGQSIEFIAGGSNTGPTTLTAGGATIPIVRDTLDGVQALSVGDIIAGNLVKVTYSSTGGEFHMQSLTNFWTLNVQQGITGGSITSLGNATIGGAGLVTGNFGVGGVLTVTGGIQANGSLTTTMFTAQAGATFMAGIAVVASATIGANLSVAGQIRTGGAGADTLYSGNGAVVLSYGSGVRATNTVTARATIGATSFNSAFGMASVANPSAGVYNFAFVEATQNNTYQVAATAAFTAGSVLLVPVVSNKTTSGFTVTYYSVTTSGVASIGSGTSDIIVTGGN